MPKRIPVIIVLVLCLFKAAAQNDFNSRMASKLLGRLESCKTDTQKIGILISLYQTELSRYPDYKRKTLLDSADQSLAEAKVLNAMNHNHVPPQTIEIAEVQRYFALSDAENGNASSPSLFL